MSDKSEDAVKVLTKRLKKKKDKGRKPFADGTVVAWVGGGLYKYAAIFAGGRWYITGGARFYGGKPSYSDEEFMNILGRPDATDVRVAAEWTVIEGTEAPACSEVRPVSGRVADELRGLRIPPRPML